MVRLLVAEQNQRIVGMCHWTRIYDLFWAMFGGELEWLYVRPAARGRGIPAVLVAEVCRDRLSGGEFLKGAGEADETAALYERIAMGWPARTVYVSAEAFHVLADHAGRSPRDIVRGLPAPELNHVSRQTR